MMTTTPAITIPAVPPFPELDLPLPNARDVAVGTLLSDDCDVAALSLLPVVEASDVVIELDTISEAIDEVIEPV
jgi:hypothetical protein